MGWKREDGRICDLPARGSPYGQGPNFCIGGAAVCRAALAFRGAPKRLFLLVAGIQSDPKYRTRSGSLCETSKCYISKAMPFDQKTLNAFEMTCREAACEVAASVPDHRAFVAIYPPLIDKGVRQWCVRRFEVPVRLIDEYFAEEDLVKSFFYRFDRLEQVEDQLTEWGLDPGQFDAPWKCDYPL